MSENMNAESGRWPLAGTILLIGFGVSLYWAMFYSAGFGDGFSDQRAKTEASRYERDLAGDIKQACGKRSHSELPDCIAKVVATQRESIRGESDLAAQWEAARWVKLAGFAAMAQLLATIVGLYYIKGTLDETRKAVIDTGEATAEMRTANKLTAEGYLTSHRPWLKVELIPDEPAFLSTTQFEVHHAIRIENIGKGPAAILNIDMRHRDPGLTVRGPGDLQWNEAPDAAAFFSSVKQDRTSTHVLPSDDVKFLHDVKMKFSEAYHAKNAAGLHALMYALDVNCVFEFEGRVFRSSLSFLVTLTEAANNGFVALPAHGKKKINWDASPMFLEYA
jgi:hypothetical protein